MAAPTGKTPKTTPRKATNTLEPPAARRVAEAGKSLFEGLIHPRFLAANDIVSTILTFANDDYQRKAMFVDKKALLLAIIAHGLSTASEGHTSRWLVDWLADNKGGIFGALNNDARALSADVNSAADSIANGLEPRLSSTMRTKIMPRAVALAELTVGRDLAELRHILFALLDFPGSEWPSSTEPKEIEEVGSFAMTEHDFRDLRAHLAEAIAVKPERGEKVEVWKMLVESPFEEVWAKFVPDARPPTLTPAPTPPPPTEDLTGFQIDDPAEEDNLNRKGFASALADIIVEAQRRNAAAYRAASRSRDRNFAFMVHLDGPWGSGKSSVLEFIRTRLVAEEPSWLVVEYNAWKLQRLEPPWWTLITQIQLASEEQARLWLEKAGLWLLGRLSRIWMFALPILLGAAIAAAFVGFGVAKLVGGKNGEFAGVVSAIGGMTAIIAFGRNLLSSSSTLKGYESLKNDPYRPVMRHFDLMVRAIERPVIVLIDDLDRCDTPYVNAMIEGIQTMMRGTPVTYVIAADRRWICTAFEKRFETFNKLAPNPGHPFGHLFLEKIFQLSTTLPVMSDELRQSYWDRLLQVGKTVEARKVEREEALREAEVAIAGLSSQEELLAAIQTETAETPKKQALRTAAARQVATPVAMEKAEHELAKHPGLMERNPRGMKRLLTAVTMNRSRLFSEGRAVPLIAIARWTALELRWPMLAERLAETPALLDPDSDRDTDVEKLLGTREVGDVIGRDGDEAVLNSEAIKAIAG